MVRLRTGPRRREMSGAREPALSDENIAHYQKIVVALNETIRLMAEIDKVIEQHGGWPGPFATPEP